MTCSGLHKDLDRYFLIKSSTQGAFVPVWYSLGFFVGYHGGRGV